MTPSELQAIRARDAAVQFLSNGTAGDLDRRALLAYVDELREAASELADLMQGVIDGEYTPDSFTLQPIRAALGESHDHD